MSTAVRRHAQRRGQTGVVLFVAMIVLLVLSLLGLMGARSAIAECKMAGSERDRQLARIATSSALADARAKISQLADAFGADQVCTHLACLSRDASAPLDALAFMQSAAPKAAAKAFRVDLSNLGGADATARLAVNASYVIEDLGLAPGSEEAATANSQAQDALAKKIRFFHITAAAAGGSGSYLEADEIVYGVAQ